MASPLHAHVSIRTLMKNQRAGPTVIDKRGASYGPSVAKTKKDLLFMFNKYSHTLPRWPRKRSPPQHMQVDMKHRLPRTAIAIQDNAIAVFRDTIFLRNFARRIH